MQPPLPFLQPKNAPETDDEMCAEDSYDAIQKRS